jgi:hypothetical protein
VAGRDEFRKLNDLARRSVQRPTFCRSNAWRVSNYCSGEILVKLTYQARVAGPGGRLGAISIVRTDLSRFVVGC